MCNNAQMDWNDLRFVLAVSRHGSLSAAGDALGVAHTTVGRRLRELEGELGISLFTRHPNGMRATAAGAELSEAAKAMEAQLHRAEARIAGRDTDLRGELRITTLDWLFEALAPRIRSFCERYPEVDLTVRASEGHVSLYRREADIALRLTNKPDPSLAGRRLMHVDFAVYGQPALVARHEADWKRLPWLHWERGSEMNTWLDHWLAHNAPGAPIAMRLGEDTLVRRAALQAGIGVHPLPCIEGDALGLTQVGPVLDAFGHDVWMLRLPELRHNRRVRAFMAHLANDDGAASAGEATPST